MKQQQARGRVRIQHMLDGDFPTDAATSAYLERRLAQELTQAEASDNAYVARVHREAAQIYRARLDNILSSEMPPAQQYVDPETLTKISSRAFD